MDAIALHLAGLRGGWEQDNFCKRLAEEISKVLPDIIDWRLKPPTKAQIALAKIVCHQLEVSMPTDAIKYRGDMCRFLEIHQPKLRGSSRVVDTPPA